jgi:methionyl-tRNA synthetase
MNKKKVLVAVAWPYVNGDLHIGHLAGYLLPADIFARFNRLIGNEVLMVSGSDCFGTPITVEADKRKVSPEVIVNEYHKKDVELFFDVLGLTYDNYTLTNNPDHIKVTQDFFVKFLDDGLLFIDTQQQYYSPTEKRFLPDRYVVGECPYCGFKDSRSDQCDNCGKLIAQGELINPISNLSKEPVELRDTQHYFVDWPKLENVLRSYVNSNGAAWKEWVYQETLGWLEEGLKPRAITRDLDWGVPIPTDRMSADKIVDGIEHKRIYVWFDAVIGYLSASISWAKQYNTDWKKFWFDGDVKHYYFMGKDNLVFHTLFWPGQLIAYDKKLHLPDVASINMFLNYEGKQFSKSRGWTLPIKDLVEKYGNDAVRFYLTLIMPETRDASFVWADFAEKNNGVLVATLGNFIHRVLSIAKGLEFRGDFKEDDKVQTAITGAYQNCKLYLEKCEFRNYVNEILTLAAVGNNFVDNFKVWELKKTNPERFALSIYNLGLMILAARDLMTPLMPHASDKLSESLGLSKVAQWPELGTELQQLKILLGQVKLTSDLKPLFSKIEIEPTNPKL